MDQPQPDRDRRRRRRRAGALLGGLILCAALPFLVPRAIDRLAGSSAWRALEPGAELSPAARSLLDEVLEGLRGGSVLDYHTHLAGVGEGSGCWIHPDMRSLAHPYEWFRLRFYLSAAGVELGPDCDRRYAERLVRIVRALPYRARQLLLAFDYRYDEAGRRDLERSTIHVPNDYVVALAREFPDLFEPCVSVHPYRADAVEELVRWAAEGVRYVKWLPNAMGIDPASERCDAFYAAMHAHGMVLLSHTGREEAVHVADDQELGNPLRLRHALDAGVRVIAAHCASSGESADLDHGDVPCSSFELFLRLMEEPRYEGLLYGDISTLTQVNRYGTALARVLERSDLHARLVNGSDWPLPAIDVLYSLRRLIAADLLDRADSAPLRELFQHHPLLFDLALKRRVRAPGSGARFPASLFLAAPGLPGGEAPAAIQSGAVK